MCTHSVSKEFVHMTNRTELTPRVNLLHSQTYSHRIGLSKKEYLKRERNFYKIHNGSSRSVQTPSGTWEKEI